MTRFILILFIAAVGYLGYTQYFRTSRTVNASSYSLSSVEQQPIPKNEFYSLWTAVAINKCDGAKENHNLTPEECRDKVNERRALCESNMKGSTPDTIGTVALTKQLGRQYLECVTPHYFCKGVEVRTEEELRRHCQ